MLFETKFSGPLLFSGEMGSVALQAGVEDGAILAAAGVGGAIRPRTLSFGVTVLMGNSFVAITTGDFNSDGHIDLTTAHQPGPPNPAFVTLM